MATFGIELAGADIGASLVSKEYLIDRYPDIADVYKTAGLWGWGKATLYALGQAVNAPSSTPVQTDVGGTTWRQCSGGGYFGGAVKTDGTLWMWGRNSSYQQGSGNGYGDHNSTPAQVAGGGTTWKTVACGYDWAVALKDTGTLWVWGSSGYYQNGIDNSVRTTPTQFGSYAGWKDVRTNAVGGSVGALKNDGTLWIWGQNYQGMAGGGITGVLSSPVQFNTGVWKTFSIGQYHAAAIRPDGTLWSAGRGNGGQLGNGDTSPRSSVVQVVGGGAAWKQVACGPNHTLAIRTDGTLWGWGINTNGVLGTNDLLNASTPVQTVAGGTNWKSIRTHTHAAGIKSDGTLWMWGNNAQGRSGQSTTLAASFSSPIQVAAGGTNWKEAVPTAQRTHAIRDHTADFGIGTL